MRGVHITHLHAGAIPAQATRAECRQPALMGEFSQWIVLVHELAELRGAEKLLQRRGHRTDIDQGRGRDGLDILGGHPVPHDAFHPAQAGAQLILDQLSHGPQAAVTEMVDVIGFDDQGRCIRASQLGAPLVQGAHIVDRGHDVVDGQHLGVERQAEAQLLVDLVPADLG